jgi:glutamate-ammonia-ligase adenylyltransferase
MHKRLGSSLNRDLSEGEIQDFHLKQGAGGIVDIEFMVQYAVLAWGTENPAICEWTDNIRIIEALQETGFIEADVAKQLTSIYKSYRQCSHRLSLQQQASSV